MPLFFRRSLLLLLLNGALAGAAIQATAQAIPTVRRGAQFTTFAQATILSPDWGQTKNHGYSLGFDYTRFVPAFIQPALEFRFTRATGRTVNEKTFLGGGKFQTTFHGIQPYAVALLGKGFISFNYNNPGGQSDSSIVYGLGGGAEYNVTPLLKLRADFVHEHWNLDPNTLTPTTLNFGVAYTVPFHGHGGMR